MSLLTLESAPQRTDADSATGPVKVAIRGNAIQLAFLEAERRRLEQFASEQMRSVDDAKRRLQAAEEELTRRQREWEAQVRQSQRRRVILPAEELLRAPPGSSSSPAGGAESVRVAQDQILAFQRRMEEARKQRDAALAALRQSESRSEPPARQHHSQGNHDRLLAENESLRTECSRLQAQFDEMAREHRLTQSQFEKLNQEREQAQQHLRAIQSERDQAVSREAQARQEMERLRAEIAQPAAAEVIEPDEEFVTLAHEIIAKRQGMARQASDLSQREESLRGKYDALHDQLTQNELALRRRTEELEQRERQIAARENDLRHRLDEAAAEQSRLDELRVQLQQQTAALRLQQDEAAARQRLADEELTRLRTELTQERLGAARLREALRQVRHALLVSVDENPG